MKKIKKPMHLFFRLIIAFVLIYTLGNLLVGMMYEDSTVAKATIRQTYILALIIVPLHHFMLRRKYHKYVKTQLPSSEAKGPLSKS